MNGFPMPWMKSIDCSHTSKRKISWTSTLWWRNWTTQMNNSGKKCTAKSNKIFTIWTRLSFLIFSSNIMIHLRNTSLRIRGKTSIDYLKEESGSFHLKLLFKSSNSGTKITNLIIIGWKMFLLPCLKMSDMSTSQKKSPKFSELWW